LNYGARRAEFYVGVAHNDDSKVRFYSLAMSAQRLFNNGMILRKIFFYLIDSSSFIKVLSILTISCTVFANREENCFLMFYEKIYKSVLVDRVTEQTRKFIKILLRGERYPGEYKDIKDSLERIQKQLLWEEKRSDFNISVSAPGKLMISVNKT